MVFLGKKPALMSSMQLKALNMHVYWNGALGSRMSALTSLQFPATQNISMLTGSLAFTLLWSLGLSVCCFWPLDQEEGFLARETELFFLGVTAAGFFSFTIFTVGVAAVVNGFLAVVEGARVVWKPAVDGTGWLLYMGVVRGTLCVHWLYGSIRGVVRGWVKG